MQFYAEGHFLSVINYVVSAIDNYYESKPSSIEVESRAISHIKRDELINEVQNLFYSRLLSLVLPPTYKLAQAKFNLEKIYGSFGILEQDNCSVGALKKAAP